MNLKRTLFTGLAAVGLMASIAAPIATAGPTGGTTTATVVLTNNGGTFDASFCGPVWLTQGGGFQQPGSDPVDVTSATGATAQGGFGICYTDTKASRPGFTSFVQASDFTSGISFPNPGHVPGTYTIPASGFNIDQVANPIQGQWGVTTPGGFDIGDIGSYNGAVNVTGGGPIGWVGGSLATNPKVGYAWNGVGTGNGTPVLNIVDGTLSLYTVTLDVPAGAIAGTYTSNMTLSLTLGQP